MFVPIELKHLTDQQILMLSVAELWCLSDHELTCELDHRAWRVQVYCQQTMWNETFRTFRLQSTMTDELVAELVVYLDQPTRLLVRTADGESPAVEIDAWLTSETPHKGVERAARTLLAEHNLRWECSANW